MTSDSQYIRYDLQKYEKWGITHLIEMSLFPANVLARIKSKFGVQWKSDNKSSRESVDHGL